MKIFDKYSIKDLHLKNRIVMPPMCMYSTDDTGRVTDWHYAHYISRAVGGVGLIIVEATAVKPNGRISSNDLGIWNDEQIAGLKRLTEGCKENGAAIALQLAHAGRKCLAENEIVVGPSPIEFSERYPKPKELNKEEIDEIIQSFKDGARRAAEAGFDAIEIHGAHGYLINEFLSPASNKRSDEYGGSLENRVRFLKEILKAVREIWPSNKPIFLRVSAEEYIDDGIHINKMVEIVNMIKEYIDIVHVSSGGLAYVSIDAYPGYQVRLAEAIKSKCQVPTIAVGLINTYEQAEEILSNDRADLVAMGRALLRNPYWVLQTAFEKNKNENIPKQYERGYIKD